MILSSKPANRRRYLPISTGSKRPCRSRGIDSSSLPLSIRSASRFFSSSTRPPLSNTVAGSRPSSSWSTTSSAILPSLFAAIPSSCPYRLHCMTHEHEISHTLLQQLRVELREARRVRDRHHKVAPRVAHKPFDLALVVALARPSEAVGEQIVRLQLAEDPRPLPPAIAQDARYRQLEVVVQDRARHPAEELEADVVSFAEGFRALPGICLHQAGVAVRQVHRKEVDLPLLPADHRQRFAEVDLRVPWMVSQL